MLSALFICLIAITLALCGWQVKVFSQLFYKKVFSQEDMVMVFPLGVQNLHSGHVVETCKFKYQLSVGPLLEERH